MDQNIYVKMEGISKSFGTVKANDNVNLTVKKGEIHALLGENGAGKSTLMNMLSGFYKPDSGSIYIHGEAVKFDSPKDSIKKGIGMIHQHYKLVEAMTAAQNIVLGQKGSFFLSQKKVKEKIKKVAESYGLNINYDKKIYEMSIGEKQGTEILKVLYQGADILIMDDDDSIRDILSAMLKHLGYTPVEARDGEEAIDIFYNYSKTGKSFKAVILDLTVPGGMGGEKAVVEIRKINNTVPVFVSSGYSQDPVISRPGEFGFSASIIKPFQVKELAEMLACSL